MTALRSSSLQVRVLFALMLAVGLAIRLASPPGYMPDLSEGRFEIVPCVSGQAAAAGPAGTHDHGHKEPERKPHQLCPFGALASQAWLGSDVPQLAAPLPLPTALLPGTVSPFLGLYLLRERPPQRGPPRH